MKSIFFLLMAFLSTFGNACQNIADKIFAEPYDEVESSLTLNSSITLDALSASLGEYCRDPQNKEIILSNMFLSWNPEENFTVVQSVGDEMPMPVMDVNSFLKPENDVDFQPTADAIEFSAEILKAHRYKGDLKIVPGKFEGTWLALFNTKRGPGSTEHDTIMQIPFEEYIMGKITEQAGQDIRLNAAYKGVRNDAGTNITAITNGIDTIIKTKRTAGQIVPIVTGVVTTSNILEKLYQVHAGLNDALKSEETQCLLPGNLFDAAAKQINTGQPNVVITNNEVYKQSRFITEIMLPETNTLLKREPGRGTTQMIYITQKSNLFMVIDRLGDYTSITTEKRNRHIELMIDGRIGFGVGKVSNGMFACNDQN